MGTWPCAAQNKQTARTVSPRTGCFAQAARRGAGKYDPELSWRNCRPAGVEEHLEISWRHNRDTLHTLARAPMAHISLANLNLDCCNLNTFAQRGISAATIPARKHLEPTVVRNVLACSVGTSAAHDRLLTHSLPATTSTIRVVSPQTGCDVNMLAAPRVSLGQENHCFYCVCLA